MTIQSVDRALQILLLFSQIRSPLGISELSELTQLPKGTVYGIVQTLLARGFIFQDSKTRKYRLGIKLHELGISMIENLPIVEKGSQVVKNLAERIKLISRIVIWDGDAVVVVFSAYPRPRGSFPMQFGPRVKAYCSAMGKAVLANLEEKELKKYLNRTELIQLTRATITNKEALQEELEKTRKRGFSLDREEAVFGLSCIGAPVFGEDNSIEGAISISGAPKKIFGPKKSELIDEVVKGANMISQYLQFSSS